MWPWTDGAYSNKFWERPNGGNAILLESPTLDGLRRTLSTLSLKSTRASSIDPFCVKGRHGSHSVRKSTCHTSMSGRIRAGSLGKEDIDQRLRESYAALHTCVRSMVEMVRCHLRHRASETPARCVHDTCECDRRRWVRRRAELKISCARDNGWTS